MRIRRILYEIKCKNLSKEDNGESLGLYIRGWQIMEKWVVHLRKKWTKIYMISIQRRITRVKGEEKASEEGSKWEKCKF